MSIFNIKNMVKKRHIPYVRDNDMRKYLSDKRGSVLIITVLISSIMFSIGIALTGILEKEVRRYFYNERSQRAINVANSALECVLFNDFRRLIFDDLSSQKGGTIDCGGLYHALVKGEWSKEYSPSNQKSAGSGDIAGEGAYEFVIVESHQTDFVANPGPYPCAYVTVKKSCVGEKNALGTECLGVIAKSIEVRGHNACKESGVDDDVVRRFKIFY